MYFLLYLRSSQYETYEERKGQKNSQNYALEARLILHDSFIPEALPVAA
jgi:hypothetical protein